MSLRRCGRVFAIQTCCVFRPEFMPSSAQADEACKANESFREKVRVGMNAGRLRFCLGAPRWSRIHFDDALRSALHYYYVFLEGGQGL